MINTGHPCEHTCDTRAKPPKRERRHSFGALNLYTLQKTVELALTMTRSLPSGLRKQRCKVVSHYNPHTQTWAYDQSLTCKTLFAPKHGLILAIGKRPRFNFSVEIRHWGNWAICHWWLLIYHII